MVPIKIRQHWRVIDPGITDECCSTGESTSLVLICSDSDVPWYPQQYRSSLVVMCSRNAKLSTNIKYVTD